MFPGARSKPKLGKMYGTFLMIKQLDDSEFYVRIPEFQLIAPAILN